MLDEWKEYEELTLDTGSLKDDGRLWYSNTKNDFAGYARAMTIIARRAYFHNEDGSLRNLEGMTLEERKALIAETKESLRRWCGLMNDEEREDKHAIDNWLFYYLADTLSIRRRDALASYLKKKDAPENRKEEAFRDLYELDDKLHTLIENWRKKSDFNNILSETKEANERLSDFEVYETVYSEKQLKKQEEGESVSEPTPPSKKKYKESLDYILSLIDKDSQYESAMYRKNTGKDYIRNDINKIRYDKIVANAINEGPLRKRYLVCKTNDLGIKSITEKNPEGKKLNNGQIDRMLKLAAAWLIKKDEAPEGTNNVLITKADVSNWTKSKNKLEPDETDKYRFNNEKVFCFTRVTGNLSSLTKMRLNPKWMERMDFHIVDEDKLDDFLSEHPDYKFFKDLGCGKYIQDGENKRY